ncbi:MAG TPA: carbonic anhydrase [Thermoanaerobaculia bacterium]|nr:carbonic anhydrase [Thermoanaerobaculia bacterium]
MVVQTAQGFLDPANRLAKGRVDALVLTCIDYRFVHVIPEYMNKHYPSLSYDHAILAGASLGVFTGIYPAWASTFWEHLEVAIALHGINTVIILDHRDCGAYREFEALLDTPERNVERDIHQHYMDRLGGLIMKSHRSLRVVTDLLDVPKSL